MEGICNTSIYLFQECIQFLEHCEIYGRTVRTIIDQPLTNVDTHSTEVHRGKNTVTYEARLLKALLLQLEME